MVSKQKVLLVHRFFAPDVTTYAQMLHVFARRLAAEGHEVTVVCGPPSYNGAYAGDAVLRRERSGGFVIQRLRVPGAATRFGKIAGSILFPLAVLFHVLTRRKAYDVVSVTTIPPVVMGAVATLGRARSRRTRVVYHCMDLYPEAAVALGLIESKRLASVAARVDSVTVDYADQVIVLSRDMETTLRRRSPRAAIAVCNNFILKDDVDAVGPKSTPERQRTRLIFAGNLGRFQGLEALVEGIRIAASQGADFEVLFLGAGSMTDWLNQQVGQGLPMLVWPFRPLEEAMGIIADADVAIVSLSRGVEAAAFPSKLLMYLELSRPVLCVVEPSSEIAEMIEEHGLGLVASPDDPTEIASRLVTMSAGTGRWNTREIQQTGRRLFGREKVLDEWMRLYGLN